MASTDPEFYKKTRADKFNLNSDLEDIYKSYDDIVSNNLCTVLLSSKPNLPNFNR